MPRGWIHALAVSLLISVPLQPLQAQTQTRDAAAWATRLDSSDKAERRKAQEELKASGKSAVPVLTQLLRDARAPVRQQAMDLIRAVGPVAVPQIVAMLRDPSPLGRQWAARTLTGFAPDAVDAIPALTAALEDRAADVVWDAAFALAAFHERSAPAARALGRLLGHDDSLVRTTAADALGAIGPLAGDAMPALILALRDSDAVVCRAAAQSIGKIGPPAALSAIGSLMVAFRSGNPYVRMSAATALGDIGPAARAALPVLLAARADPVVRTEVERALSRIGGTEFVRTDTATPRPVQAGTFDDSDISPVRPGEWPMLGGNPDRDAARPTSSVPTNWNVTTGENVLWQTRLGNRTYSGVAVAGGRVFVGTDNAAPRNPAEAEEQGILMAFDAETGRFLWQDRAPYMADRGLHWFLQPYTTSTPLIEDQRLYYMTAQGQLRCLDVLGFSDGRNNGPWTNESEIGVHAADVIWSLDLGTELGVYPHEAPNCSVVSVGGILMVCTSNGRDAAHSGIPSPRAPSFIGVDKLTGKVMWQVVGPSPRVLHGQWSSPSLGRVGNRTIAFFGGGDGWLYALNPANGEEVWRFDGNPKDAVWRSSSDIEGSVTRNSIIASPVFNGGRVYLAMGEDPTHGDGQGRLYAINANGTGDVTASGKAWEYTDLHRTIGTPIVHDGLIFVGDNYGQVHCVDATTGQRVWEHDQMARIWGCLLLAGRNLYVGDEAGTVVVYRANREKQILAQVEMPSPIRGSAAVAGNTLFIPTSQTLFAIRQSAPR